MRRIQWNLWTTVANGAAFGVACALARFVWVSIGEDDILDVELLAFSVVLGAAAGALAFVALRNAINQFED